jgi:hypothetical protein
MIANPSSSRVPNQNSGEPLASPLSRIDRSTSEML